MLRRVIPIIILSLVVACNNKEIPVIDIETALQNRKEVYLSDIATDIEYVALKTPFNLNRGRAIIGENVILFESSYYHRVFVFDGHGKYINAIGEKGSLPYQFSNAIKRSDLSPDEKNILITDQSQIKLFKNEGSLLKSGNMPLGEGFEPHFLGNKHIVLFRPRNGMISDGYQIYVYNMKLEPTDSLFWSRSVGKRPGGMSQLPSENFFRHKNDVFFRPCEQDTMFQIIPGKKPRASVIFSGIGNESDITWKPFGEVKGIQILSVFETEKSLFVDTEVFDSLSDDYDYKVVMFNKENGTSSSTKSQIYRSANSRGDIYVDSLNIWDDMDGLGFYGYGMPLQSRIDIAPRKARDFKRTIAADTIFITKLKSRKYIDSLSNVINSVDKRTPIVRIVHFDRTSRKSKKNYNPSKELFNGYSPVKETRNSHQWEDADWIAGFTYDSSDDTFWIGKFNVGIVEHRTRDGKILPDSFKTNPKAKIEGLAYSEHDNTLWISSPPTNELFHYDKQGNNLGDGFKVGDHERFGVYGLTYDSSDSTLWLCSPFSEIRHYTTSGKRLDEVINHRMLGSDDGRGLTFDPRDNSLWLLNNSPHKLIHIGRNGEELPGSFYFTDTLSLPDCVALDYKTNEFWIGIYGAKEYQ